MKSWTQSHEEHLEQNGTTLYTTVLRDPVTGLECRFERSAYPGSPALEWVVYFRNGGTTDTPIL